MILSDDCMMLSQSSFPGEDVDTIGSRLQTALELWEGSKQADWGQRQGRVHHLLVFKIRAWRMKTKQKWVTFSGSDIHFNKRGLFSGLSKWGTCRVQSQLNIKHRTISNAFQILDSCSSRSQCRSISNASKIIDDFFSQQNFVCRSVEYNYVTLQVSNKSLRTTLYLPKSVFVN